MPSFAPLSLQDGQSTPVAQSFTPVSLVSGLGAWYNRNTGVIASQPYVTAKTTRANGSSGLTRQQFTVNVPAYDAATGKVISTAAATIEFRIPSNATLQQRKDLRAFVASLCFDDVVEAMVENVEGLFA